MVLMIIFLPGKYLCAFIAFQANKADDSTVGVYRNKEEANNRYKLFKKCVNDVNDINNDPKSTFTAGMM